MDTTYKEIQDTFNALTKTVKYIDEKWSEIEAFIRNKKRFIFVGCGSSYSIAKSYAAICNMSAGVPASALAAGDILIHAARYKKMVSDAAVVFISRSGRTSEILKALDALLEQKISFSVLSVIAAKDTPLAEKSELSLETPWAFDESVCQTRCVTNFYFMGAYIFAKYTNDSAVLDDLKYLAHSGSGFLANAEKVAKELAPKDWNRAVVLADAELEGLAEEGALVFKEVCQLPANYYHVLDVRHGPIVLIGQHTLNILCLGTCGDFERGLLGDIKKKSDFVVAFTDNSIDADGVTSISFGRELTHIARGVPFIILCQLIAYEKSKETGANPDQPTGLDPWIAL